MANKTKINKQASNILYLQDADAKALGIIEGSVQRVFIDNKEVEVVFVDEHEVIPVSAEDKKLYQDAYKIAAKYADDAENSNVSPTSKALVARSGKDTSRFEKTNKYVDESKPTMSEKWNNFWSRFKKSPEEKEAKRLAREEAAQTRAMVRYQQNQAKQESKNNRIAEKREAQLNRNSKINDNHNKQHARHAFSNHVFTKEELEIIQSVIDKTKNSSKSVKGKR